MTTKSKPKITLPPFDAPIPSPSERRAAGKGVQHAPRVGVLGLEPLARRRRVGVLQQPPEHERLAEDGGGLADGQRRVLLEDPARDGQRRVHAVAELVRAAKAKPMSYASGGAGSPGHLTTELFKSAAGIDMTHVPYKGGGQALTDVLGGSIPLVYTAVAGAFGHVKSGKLKALAVTTLTRSPALPDVPPVADTLKGFSIDTWWGLVAPAGTPKDVLDKLNHAFTDALKAPEAKTRFANLLAEPVPTTPEQFGSFMQQELKKYEKVVKASGAKVD